MKMSTLRGMAVGLMIGSAGYVGYSMMSRRTQRKLKRAACDTVHQMMCKVERWMR